MSDIAHLNLILIRIHNINSHLLIWI